jgi:hypothetical protein
MSSVWGESTKKFENESVAPNFQGYFSKAKKDATSFV